MEKKYQVFISSTYTDLQKERQCAISCLLDMNCIPVGMEQFPASPLSQWDYIKKMIDMSDYYVLIVAGKYGTIDPEDNISYTEKEYNYAVSKNMPILTFLLDDIDKLDKISAESPADRDERKRTEEFRGRLINGNRLVKFYSGLDDLRSKLTAAMHKIIVDTPAVGWIRADKADKVDLLPKDRSVSFGVVTEERFGVSITTNLPEEAIGLLLELGLNDPNDRVDILKTPEGTFYSINSNTRHKKLNENGGEAALWENAVEMLIKARLAYSEDIDDARKAVKLTLNGYEAAEMLSRNI